MREPGLSGAPALCLPLFTGVRGIRILGSSASLRSNTYERAGLGSAALKGSLRPSALRVSGRGCSVDNEE
jgi:hypothetical protein